MKPSGHSNDELWENAYNLLCEFKEKYGRLCYPSEKYKDFRLGFWLNYQSKQLKNGNLNEYRIDKLKKIGLINQEGEFIELDDKREKEWRKMYGVLKRYLKKHGGVFPLDATEEFEGVALGEWCAYQRTKYKHKQRRLLDWQVELLDKINFPYDFREYSFNIKLKWLKDYIAENGTSIPKRGKTKQLFMFYKLLRSNYRNGNLSEERKKLVEEYKIPIDLADKDE